MLNNPKIGDIIMKYRLVNNGAKATAAGTPSLILLLLVATSLLPCFHKWNQITLKTMTIIRILFSRLQSNWNSLLWNIFGDIHL